MASLLGVISRKVRRVKLYLQRLISNEPQLLVHHMPVQETGEQENIQRESHEQRELSSRLVFRRVSVMMQEQELSTAELESCEQRGFSSKLVFRRGSVNIQGLIMGVDIIDSVRWVGSLFYS